MCAPTSSLYETQKNVLLQSSAVGASIVPETYRYRYTNKVLLAQNGQGMPCPYATLEVAAIKVNLA